MCRACLGVHRTKGKVQVGMGLGSGVSVGTKVYGPGNNQSWSLSQRDEMGKADLAAGFLEMITYPSYIHLAGMDQV